MKLSHYLGNQYRKILFHLLSMTALAVFLLLTGTQAGVLLCILIVWIIGLALSLLIDFLRTKNHIEELYAIMDGLDQKHLFMECVPKPKDLYEHHLHTLMRRAGKAMIEMVSDIRAEQTEYREYIENWVHEIKVPIASAKLTCENNKTEASRKILYQLAQIDEHVERALYYARAGYMQHDFIVQAVLLDEIVRNAIEKYRPLLIQNSVRIETDGLDRLVYTDGKWAEFMLCQILSNSVKYKSDQPLITIAASAHQNRIRLDVTDNGIGIAGRELPRIFDKGFTGSNGRQYGNTTGIGLYLVKKLADHLNVDITASSGAGDYTTITLFFPAKAFLTEM